VPTSKTPHPHAHAQQARGATAAAITAYLTALTFIKKTGNFETPQSRHLILKTQTKVN
jgi:L-lactate utilization protein LutB